jgi:hypothetical protein
MHFSNRKLHRLEQIAGKVEMVMNQMCNDFSIGLRLKHVTALPKFGTKRFVVLDDAIVNDGNFAL